jgi:hypothetical protein
MSPHFGLRELDGLERSLDGAHRLVLRAELRAGLRKPAQRVGGVGPDAAGGAEALRRLGPSLHCVPQLPLPEEEIEVVRIPPEPVGGQALRLDEVLPVQGAFEQKVIVGADLRHQRAGALQGRHGLAGEPVASIPVALRVACQGSLQRAASRIQERCPFARDGGPLYGFQRSRLRRLNGGRQGHLGRAAQERYNAHGEGKHEDSVQGQHLR